MSNGTKGNPQQGTRPSGAAGSGKSAAVGAADASTAAAVKKVLARFGNDPSKVAKAYGDLEKKVSLQGTQISRMTATLDSFGSIADQLEVDPMTGKARIKESARPKDGAPIKASGVDKAALMAALDTGMKDKTKNPTEVLVDAIITAATGIAQGTVAGLQGDMRKSGVEGRVAAHILQNPRHKPLQPFLVNWMEKQPESVQNSISLDEAAIIIKARLKRNGALEELGISDTDDEDEVDPSATHLTGGGGTPPGDKEEQDSAEDIKARIKGSGSPFENFMSKSRTRTLPRSSTPEGEELGDEE